MKTITIRYKEWYKHVFSALVAITTLCGCSDWDDHYASDQMVNASQKNTIWQNIESNDNLKQFALLAKKVGYDSILSSSQTFTVWAPVDNSYDYDAIETLNDDRLTREFIENHIARHNYTVSGTIDEKVFMINNKMMYLNGSDSYTIQDITLNPYFEASSNGMLYTIGTKIPFLANIYESLNNNDFNIDSISNYFHSYDQNKLNEEKSVVGPTIDGEITYLNAVYDKTNPFYRLCNAYINREDSNYTMIIPNNEAWKKVRKTVKSFFNYAPSFEFMENTSTGSDKKITVVTLNDAEFLSDSITNGMIMSNLFFNNNIYDNKKLSSLKNGETLECDSLIGTLEFKVYSEDAASMFEGTQRINKSNGAIFVTDDSLRQRTWTSWNPELRQEAESNIYIANVFNASPNSPSTEYVSDATKNKAISGKISNNRYCEVAPSGSNSNPEIDFYLGNVRSTTYVAYLVMVPANIRNASRETLPNRMIITMGYCNENGKNKETRLKPADGSSYFVTDPTKIDTLCLGEFTFPVAFFGTGSSSQGYYPYLRVRSAVTTSVQSSYDRTLRIDKIILRPKALDDYLKSHPDYKYDDGTY